MCVFLCHYFCNLPQQGAEASSCGINQWEPWWWLLPPCQVPLSSIFPVCKGLFYFSPLDLKQTGVLWDCVEAACPLSSRLNFDWRVILFCTLLMSWMDANVSLCLSVFLLFACEGQRDWGASVLTLVSNASNHDPVFWSTLDSFSTGRFHTGYLQEYSCESYLAVRPGILAEPTVAHLVNAEIFSKQEAPLLPQKSHLQALHCAFLQRIYIYLGFLICLVSKNLELK